MPTIAHVEASSTITLFFGPSSDAYDLWRELTSQDPPLGGWSEDAMTLFNALKTAGGV